MTAADHNCRAPNACIACGGTGGHLFPGIAVARELIARGCRVSLMISPKEIDRIAVRNLTGMELVTLPAVGLTRGALPAFLKGFAKSYFASRRHFKSSPPAIALAMGGFTSAPPILAARSAGAATFLHESNSIPGRANRWLSRFVSGAFIGFSSAAQRLHTRNVEVTGTPVRAEFFSTDVARCRAALRLDPARPVVLVMGGSQGAEGINRMITALLPNARAVLPECQWLHIAGPGHALRVEEAFRSAGISAVVHEFLPDMATALGAATVAISRAGASSLAEIAAVRLPSILVPYPAATDNHQYYNARAFADCGAARLLEQKDGTAAALQGLLLPLLKETAERDAMISKLTDWSARDSAAKIAEAMLHRSGLLSSVKKSAGCQCGAAGARRVSSAGEVAA
jgi:UDP-N-acetylglucosamine--N-acetylmuramyl-(pentapeptide) pyrophosphoryl-undecaprenol N-acetylglucosamine transferase